MERMVLKYFFITCSPVECETIMIDTPLEMDDFSFYLTLTLFIVALFLDLKRNAYLKDIFESRKSTLIFITLLFIAISINSTLSSCDYNYRNHSPVVDEQPQVPRQNPRSPRGTCSYPASNSASRATFNARFIS